MAKKTIKDVEAEEVKKNEIEEVDELEAEKSDNTSEIDSSAQLEEKEESKKEKNSKKEKKQHVEKSGSTLSSELKKVVWPKAGVVAKYTLAVVLFCLILCLFFEGINLLAAFIKGLFV
mgnify:CR=1 FL=1